MEPVIPGGSMPKVKENSKIFALGFFGFVVAVVVLAALVGIYRVYAKSATDSFTLSVAKILHLPAAKVNGAPVAYTEYVADLKAINKFRDFSRASNGAGAKLTDEQMSDQVLMRIVNNMLATTAASQLGVTVQDSDVQALKAQALQQFKSAGDIDQELMKRYGWNLATYETKVMRPYILQSKLAEKIQTDPAAVAKVRSVAQGVLDQIKGGADFAKLAEQYGQDGTAAKGGDLGYFAKGDMVPQFEAVAFALKNGEVTQNLVETSYGFHIIKAEDQKIEKVKDPTTGKMVNKEQVKARHILFRYPSVDTYLTDLIKIANIHLYLKVHDPFKALVAAK